MARFDSPLSLILSRVTEVTEKEGTVRTTGAILSAAQMWVEEELSELDLALQTGDVAGAIDAILDMQGVLACVLTGLAPREVEAAWEHYVHAQVVRDRSLDMPHHRQVEAMKEGCVAEDARHKSRALLMKAMLSRSTGESNNLASRIEAWDRATSDQSRF